MRSAPRLIGDCAVKLRVLADPTRLSVVDLLMQGPLQAGELTALLGVEQSLLSHHLRILRDAGIVRARRDGRRVLYRVDAALLRGRGRRLLDFGCCDIHFS